MDNTSTAPMRTFYWYVDPVYPYPIPYTGKETCKCCGGMGIQVNREGLKVYCPACNGTGLYPPEREITITW